MADEATLDEHLEQDVVRAPIVDVQATVHMEPLGECRSRQVAR